VAAFDPEQHEVDNSTCHLWAPKHRIAQSAYQLPQLFPNKGERNELVFRGPSPYVSNDLIREAQEQLAFVLQASFALYLVEAMHNVNDPEWYERFFPEFTPFETSERRYFKQIERVLYQFDTVDAARAEIEEILSARVDELGREYHMHFNRLLYGRRSFPKSL
jgi:hypothetical protein